MLNRKDKTGCLVFSCIMTFSLSNSVNNKIELFLKTINVLVIIHIFIQRTKNKHKWVYIYPLILLFFFHPVYDEITKVTSTTVHFFSSLHFRTSNFLEDTGIGIHYRNQ